MDPREVVVLARELGQRLEMDDVVCESLLPDPLKACSSACCSVSGLDIGLFKMGVKKIKALAEIGFSKWEGEH